MLSIFGLESQKQLLDFACGISHCVEVCSIPTELFNLIYCIYTLYTIYRRYYRIEYGLRFWYKVYKIVFTIEII